MKLVEYNVLITIDGKKLSSARCGCPAGVDGRCSHVATVLFYAHKYISSTDVTCQWNKREALLTRPTQSIEEMIMSKDKSERQLSACPLASTKEIQSIRNQCLTLLKTLKNRLPAEWLLKDEKEFPNESYIEVPASFGVEDIERVLFSNEFEACQRINRRNFLLQHCLIDDCKIIQVAKRTTQQWASPFYCACRSLCLTGYKIGSILKSIKRGTFPPSLFKTLLGVYMQNDPQKPKPKAIQHRIDNEDDAFKKFNELYEAKTGCKMEKAGFYLHESGILGATPDGINDNACLEIKCPYTHRHSDNLETSLVFPKRKSDYYFYNYDPTIKSWVMNKDHWYYNQIQSQLYFAKKSVGYFFVYTFNTHKVFKVMKDPAWQENIDLLINFYANEFADFILENPEMLPARTL